jgi:hypothetical protein
LEADASTGYLTAIQVGVVAKPENNRFEDPVSAYVYSPLK